MHSMTLTYFDPLESFTFWILVNLSLIYTHIGFVYTTNFSSFSPKSIKKLSLLPLNSFKFRYTFHCDHGLNEISKNRACQPRNSEMSFIFRIYVGESIKKRFIVPLAYLRHSSFQTLLKMSEEEFGYDHPMGGLTLPCKEETFLEITHAIL
ncbi:hypothetical protein LXL04_025374 [Taraxacum kok-saghyz]